MQPNFERINEVSLERENVVNAIRSFIEANNLWMFEVDGDASEIRFQVWKDKDGFPMMREDGIENLVAQIKAEGDMIPEGANVELLQMAGGGVTVSIQLDKTE